MKIPYPQLTPDATDEESHYGVMDKEAIISSPEPERLLNVQEEKKDLNIGWDLNLEENTNQKQENEDLSGMDNLMNKVSQSHHAFRSFLILISIIELILVSLLLIPVTNKAHNIYACVAIFAFKLVLIARFCWSGVALENCKAWLQAKNSDASSLHHKSSLTTVGTICDKKLSNDSVTFFKRKSKDSVAPRTLKFRRGRNGKFGIHHIENSITRVDEESPARNEGVKRGDQIIFVNGIDIETLSHEEISKLFERVSGQISLTLRFNPDRLQYLEIDE